MSSIRNVSTGFRRSLLALALAGIVPAIGGCNLKYQRPVVAANDEIPTDEAMEARQWPQQEALFANSSLVAFRNRFPYNYETTREQRTELGYIASPLAFIAQSIWFPITFFKNPPGTKQTFRTVEYEPTYTAMPSRPEPVEGISRLPEAQSTVKPVQSTPTPTPIRTSPPTPTPMPTPSPAPAPAPARTPAPSGTRAPTPAPSPAPAPSPTPK